MPAPRNSTRAYRSQLRKEQAAETRLRVVSAAAQLFSVEGYQATTLAQIAKLAGVSAETVQRHGPKSSLLQSAMEMVSFGVEGETDFFATEPGRAMAQVSDPDELARLVGQMMLGINAPSAGLWMTLVGAARGDNEVRSFHADMLIQIRGQIERVLQFVGERGWLRDDVEFEELVEAVCIICSVETFVRFVLQDGKPVEQYTAFVSRTVRETVLARRG